MKNRAKPIKQYLATLLKYLRAARKQSRSAIRNKRAVTMEIKELDQETVRGATKIAKRMGNFTFQDFAIASLMSAIDCDPGFRRKHHMKRFVPGRVTLADKVRYAGRKTEAVLS